MVNDTFSNGLPMTILETRVTNMKGNNMNKIAGMKMNGCYIPYLTRNNFVFLIFYKKKGMVGNKKEKMFLMNGDFF